MEKNDNDHYRGLHIVILNPSKGTIEFAMVFDTYESSDSFEEFISGKNFPKGSIIIAACKDECTSNLS